MYDLIASGCHIPHILVQSCSTALMGVLIADKHTVFTVLDKTKPTLKGGFLMEDGLLLFIF